MNQLRTILNWTDKNLLKWLLVGFVFVIPLFPKLPLQMINYTYIALRVDDVYMAVIGLVFAIQFFRRKVNIPAKILWLFLAFWLSVFISFIWGYYVQKTIIIDHLGLLHSLRRIEYMLIFLITLTQIKSRKDFEFFLKLLFASVFLFVMYGYGQKYLGWPAVQTMNPEYAKGYILVLDAWSRISSTFAGHYDLSGTLTLLLPPIIGFALTSKKKWYFLLFSLAVGTLVLSATRASYVGYLLATVSYLIYIKKFKVLAFVLLITIIFTPLSDNLTNRISRTFQSTKVSIDTETGDARVTRRLKPDDLPPGDFGASSQSEKSPEGLTITQLSSEEALAARLRIQDDVMKEALKDGKQYTADELNQTVDEILSRQVFVTKYLPDISISTRLQVSWPRAIVAFLKNPLLGSGPSSLGEATDGDYFRWLGEKGLLGTGLFLSILGFINLSIFKKARKMSKLNSYVFHGFVFGFMGAFINASTIDIFEASKFAYIFWFTAGLFYAGTQYFENPKVKTSKLKV
jgi:hypothetical protein